MSLSDTERRRLTYLLIVAAILLALFSIGRASWRELSHGRRQNIALPVRLAANVRATAPIYVHSNDANFVDVDIPVRVLIEAMRREILAAKPSPSKAERQGESKPPCALTLPGFDIVPYPTQTLTDIWRSDAAAPIERVPYCHFAIGPTRDGTHVGLITISDPVNGTTTSSAFQIDVGAPPFSAERVAPYFALAISIVSLFFQYSKRDENEGA